MTHEGTGFSFREFSGYWMVKTIERALDVYHNDREGWRDLQQNAMARDFSWDTASQAYLDLYRQLLPA